MKASIWTLLDPSAVAAIASTVISPVPLSTEAASTTAAVDYHAVAEAKSQAQAAALQAVVCQRPRKNLNKQWK